MMGDICLAAIIQLSSRRNQDVENEKNYLKGLGHATTIIYSLSHSLSHTLPDLNCSQRTVTISSGNKWTIIQRQLSKGLENSPSKVDVLWKIDVGYCSVLDSVSLFSFIFESALPWFFFFFSFLHFTLCEGKLKEKMSRVYLCSSGMTLKRFSINTREEPLSMWGASLYSIFVFFPSRQEYCL